MADGSDVVQTTTLHAKPVTPRTGALARLAQHPDVVATTARRVWQNNGLKAPQPDIQALVRPALTLHGPATAEKVEEPFVFSV